LKETDFKISLKAARINAEMTQKEAAKSINICRDTLKNWENGKGEPRASQLKALCNLYNCPENIIFLRRQSS
jgi:DNA-binding XRE family transcriptional regulator